MSFHKDKKTGEFSLRQEKQMCLTIISFSISMHSFNYLFIFFQGDLGAIENKYDIAISTACGPLDFIVVDTMDTAQKGVQFLKKNNIGSTTFIALDKVSQIT